MKQQICEQCGNKSHVQSD